jgi:AraC family transcriptional regulator
MTRLNSRMCTQQSRLDARITCGHPVRSVAVDGFTIVESSYQPMVSLPSHSHVGATVSLLRRGSFIETSPTCSQDCRPFDLIVQPAGAAHWNQFGPLGATCFHIAFDPHRLDSTRGDAFNRPSYVRGGMLPSLIIRLEQELSLTDIGSALALEAVIFEVLAQIVRWPTRDKVPAFWLRQVRDLIEGNVGSQLSLRKIADRVGMHPGHLARGFRRHYQCSVGEYLRKVRVEAAMRLIVQARMPLVEIATSLGFYDQSHFTRAFRMRTGTTPAKFAAQVSAGRSRTRMPTLISR